jgi:tetratricopeptide (TPR) repeat protein
LNNYNAALTDYNKVLLLESNNAYVYFNRGVLYAEIKKYKNAIDDFDRVLAINPSNIQALFNRAKLRETEKDYSDAIKDYTKIIELYPYFMEAYYNRSLLKTKLKDFAGAKKDIETGKVMSEVFHAKNSSQLKRDSTLVLDLMRLNADFNQGATSNSDSIVLQYEPFYYIVNKNDLDNTKYMYCAILDKVNKTEGAKFVFTNGELANNAIKNNTGKDVFSWTDLFYKTNNLFLHDAFETVKSKLKSDSLNSLLYFQKAIIITRQIEQYGNSSEGTTIGHSSFESEKSKTRDKWLEVISNYSKSIQIDPTFYIAYYNRGNVKSVIHDFDGALKDYETALRLNPDFSVAHFNYGFLLYYLNKKQEACVEFSRAGELGLLASYSFIRKYCSSVMK